MEQILIPNFKHGRRKELYHLYKYIENCVSFSVLSYLYPAKVSAEKFYLCSTYLLVLIST